MYDFHASFLYNILKQVSDVYFSTVLLWNKNRIVHPLSGAMSRPSTCVYLKANDRKGRPLTLS